MKKIIAALALVAALAVPAHAAEDVIPLVFYKQHLGLFFVEAPAYEADAIEKICSGFPADEGRIQTLVWTQTGQAVIQARREGWIPVGRGNPQPSGSFLGMIVTGTQGCSPAYSLVQRMGEIDQGARGQEY